jgi:hypothetical protein
MKYSPRAAPRTKRKFSMTGSVVACRTYRTRGSRCTYSAQMAGVSSVEPLSEITSSKSVNVCASSASMAARISPAPL